MTKDEINLIQREMETLIQALPKELRWQSLSRIRTIGKKAGDLKLIIEAAVKFTEDMGAFVNKIVGDHEKGEKVA